MVDVVDDKSLRADLNSYGLESNFRLIGQGHRAIELAGRPDARLYGSDEFSKVAARVSPEFWEDTFLPLLRRAASGKIASRLTAAAKRARTNSSVYGTGTPGPAEVATEILFDSHLMQPHEDFRSRADVRQSLESLRESRGALCLALPLFSRKPISPVKNRGPYPDLAEIASLLRCYQIAALLSGAYEEEVRFLVFADGAKYRRACGDPLSLIRNYQEALNFWCAELRIGSLVEVIDYEEAVHSALGSGAVERREDRYREYCRELHARYDRYFDPRNCAKSLADLSVMSAEGEQLCFIFRSIASSIYYRAGDLAERLARHEDAAVGRYLGYIARLADFTDCRDEEDLALRAEAWGATVRYVAISEVDRHLNIWAAINPAGVKLTTHAKPGELKFRPTRSTLTAQHCVGGITRAPRTGNKVTYRYRLEYESRGDIPLLFEEPSVPTGDALHPGPIRAMVSSGQPICYLSRNAVPAWETLSDCVVDF